jgi:hypothetical protein
VDKILSWNQNSSKKNCVPLFQVIPVPRLQAILNTYSWATSYFKQKGFTQYSDNIPAKLKLKLQYPNNILATETTLLQIKLKTYAMLILIQQLQ